MTGTDARKTDKWKWLAAFVLGCIVVAIALGVFLLVDEEDLTMNVNPQEVKAGGDVEIVLSDAAEEQVAYPGLTVFQVQTPSGDWSSQYVLSVADYYGGGEDDARPDINPYQRFLFTGTTRTDFDPEVIRVPDVDPGTYRLAKELESADGASGAVAVEPPNVTTEIEIVP